MTEWNRHHERLDAADRALVEALRTLGNMYGETDVAEVAESLRLPSGQQWVQRDDARREVVRKAVQAIADGDMTTEAAVDHMVAVITQMEVDERSALTVVDGPEEG